MKPEMREKILAYNKRRKAEGDKATDMDVLIKALAKLPWGQLKKVLSDEVKEVLKKYGLEG